MNMSNDSDKNANRVRKQKILVVVLLLGLVVALCTQPEKAPDVAKSQTPVAMPVKISSTASTESDQEPVAPIAITHGLPTRSLQDILATELFRKESSAHQANELPSQTPVVAIYGSGRSRSALVGKKTIVKSGQSLPSVGEVVEVGGNGIRVKP